MPDMLIKDLPLEILKIFRRRQKEQEGKETNNGDNVNHGLKWAQTIEGHEFWSKINRGDFTEFYNMYLKTGKNEIIDNYLIF